MVRFEEILDIFRQEASEHLAALEKGFLDLESTDSADDRSAIINRVFRHAHALKGAARAVELFDIQHSAQDLEDTLDALRDDPDAITTEAIEQGLSQFDKLRNTVDDWHQEEIPEETTEAVSPSEPPEVEEDTFTVRVSSDRLDRMLSLASELRISQRTADLHAQQLDAVDEHLEELPTAGVQISAGLKSAIGNWQSAVADQLIRIKNGLHNKQVREGLLLKALESDIHEARLLPLSMLAESMRRPVRDLAQSLGKSIRFEVDVGTVTLDKAVIEALKDPLLHMIRNAAHHGIETPSDRRIAGKEEQGCIQLRATRRGDRVLIQMRDDGRGVNFDKLRERLRQTGELGEAEIDGLSEAELAAFLYQAGFTTAAQADEISGRGVGLDAVSDSVRRLHGSVDLESSSPAGTTFVIAVPVSISTLRILTVISGGQYYGIPSSSIIRTARIRPDELGELEGNLILTVDGEPVPWILLSDLVGSPSGPRVAEGDRLPYVLIYHDGKRLALGVDDTEDELEIILKPLGFPLTGMSGIAGGTIRPDGSVQVVLDTSITAFRTQQPTRPATGQPQKPAPRVLVVDDSPTTRTIVRNVLAAAGCSVRMASDGVDALERLRYQAADLVVSDVQMPRMNGIELTRHVKSQFGIPVVLVTGMEKEQDRREGLAAGADAYVVKSTFEGEGLLEIVRQFI